MSETLFNNIWVQLMLAMGMYVKSYFFRKSSLRINKKWLVLVPYVACILWMNLCFLLFINTVIKLIGQVIIFSLIAKYTYDEKIKSIALKAILFTLILVLSEITVLQLWDILDPTPIVVEYGNDDEILHYSLQIVIYILTFGIIVIVEKLFDKNEGEFVKEDMISFLVSMITSFTVSICIFFNMEYIEDDRYIVVFLICSLSMLLSFIYNTNIYSKRLEKRLKEQEEKRSLFEMEMQRDYYQQKLEDEEKMKSIYHDFKNHLLILEEHEECERMKVIIELREKVTGYEDYQSTGNKYLDILLKEKSTIARQEDIETIIDIAFENIDFISSLDISSIFGNLFDNAIEACRKIPKGDRCINLKIREQNRLLIISMRNSLMLSGEEVNYQISSKKDKLFHGFGIKNITRSLQNYDGYHSITQEGNEFVFNITIPMRRNQSKSTN